MVQCQALNRLNVENLSCHVNLCGSDFSNLNMDSRSAFQDLAGDYDGEVRHYSISKKRLSLLQNIK